MIRRYLITARRSLPDSKQVVEVLNVAPGVVAWITQLLALLCAVVAVLMASASVVTGHAWGAAGYLVAAALAVAYCMLTDVYTSGIPPPPPRGGKNS